MAPVPSNTLRPNSPVVTAERTRTGLPLIGLALIMTIANALKPVHMDDTAYLMFASQIAQHPADPYGFRMFWYQHPEPANQILAPPVLPYWLAPGIRLFGVWPVALKLWLFPFALVLVAATYRLLERCSATPPLWLTAMVVFSPAILGGFNFMLDVPALALALASLVIFMSACERKSAYQALAAGVLAAFAVQTKYSAIAVPAAMLLYAWRFDRPRLGVLTVVVAAVLFTSWECFTAWKYGESHLLCNIRQKHTISISPRQLIWPLMTILGGVCPAVLLMNLYALQLSKRLILGASVLLASMFATIGFARQADSESSLTETLFAISGILFLASLIVIVRRLFRRAVQSHDVSSRSFSIFLVGWLVLELLAYFALSPFPATRRVMSLIVISTLLAGRLIGLTKNQSLKPVRWIALGQVGLCVLFGWVDYREAAAQRDVVFQAQTIIGPSGQAWFIGHWGLQFYAEQAGMHPLIPPGAAANPAEQEAAGTPKKGDYLLLPDQHIYQQAIRLHPNDWELVSRIEIADELPYRSVVNYYMGGLPLEPWHGPRILATILRAKADFQKDSPQRAPRTQR